MCVVIQGNLETHTVWQDRGLPAAQGLVELLHEGQVVKVCKYIHHTIVLEQVLERTEHTVRRDTVAPGVQTLPREPRVRTHSPSLYSQRYRAESQDHPLLKIVRGNPRT